MAEASTAFEMPSSSDVHHCFVVGFGDDCRRRLLQDEGEVEDEEGEECNVEEDEADAVDKVVLADAPHPPTPPLISNYSSILNFLLHFLRNTSLSYLNSTLQSTASSSF